MTLILFFLKVEMKRVQQVDDDLTDLSWLVQMNNSTEKQSFPEPNMEPKTKKYQRMPKPLTVINGPTSGSSRSSFSAFSPYQYSNEENHFVTQQSLIHAGMKRKCAPAVTYHSTKRFHSEQTLPIYPTPPELIYYEPTAPITPPPSRVSTTSRYMLLKNDPSLSDTVPTVPMTTNHFHSSTKILEEENLYSDDIEHLLDIFKNEVEMIGLDPIASTSTGDGTLDMSHCLSSNEFCTY